MRYSIRTVTPVGDIVPVFDVTEAKQHLQVDFDDDDEIIAGFVLAAQGHVEKYTGQVLTPREMELALRGFPSSDGGVITIPRAPVTAIGALDYTDGDGGGASLVEADWRWSESEPELVLPAWSTSWPSAADERGSVRVSFTAGYDEGLCEGDLVAATKLMLGHLYANREGVVTGTTATEMPLGVMQLCAPYRRVSL